jgi:hypothetical protein
MRFTLRDLLWLMVVVGLTVGWCLDHREHERSVESAYDRWCIDVLSEVIKTREGGKVSTNQQSVKVAFPDGSLLTFPSPSD